MRIVYVCPNCGADIEDIVLTSNPPIPAKRCTQCDWWWQGEREDEEVVRLPFTPPVPYNWNTSGEYVPKCCAECDNHPKNGGSGICMCVLPYLSCEGVTC